MSEVIIGQSASITKPSQNSIKDLVIFDLDGTLCDISHRLHFIKDEPGYHRQTPNWKAFHEACVNDVPNIPTLTTMMLYLRQGYNVMVLTGRSDAVMQKTVDWFARGGISRLAPGMEKFQIAMRRDGDHCPDHELKRRFLQELGPLRERILCVYEDRSSVVKMWRDEGITCYQVAEGDF